MLRIVYNFNFIIIIIYKKKLPSNTNISILSKCFLFIYYK